MSDTERRRLYARALWDAMVSDSVPDDETLWREGFYDAADAVIRIADCANTRSTNEATAMVNLSDPQGGG